MCFSSLFCVSCALYTSHFTFSLYHIIMQTSFSMKLIYLPSPLPFRLVHSGPGKSSPLLDSDLSFGLRSGTKQGVETHVFRVDSAKELSTWTHLLVEGCHNAAELIKEVTTGTDTEICSTPRLFLSSFFLLHSSSTYGKKNSNFVLHDKTEVQGLTPTGVSLCENEFLSWHCKFLWINSLNVKCHRMGGISVSA